MVKAMDNGIEVSEFEHQLRYYVHFRTNTFSLYVSETLRKRLTRLSYILKLI